MQSFSDTQGRSWSLSLDGYTQEKVRTGVTVKRDVKNADGSTSQQETGLLLTSIGDDNFKLLADLYDPNQIGQLLVPILWCMVEDEADERQITPKQFARALSGDALRSAVDALVRAIADFFTNPARDALLKMMEVGQQVQAKAEVMAKSNLDRELTSLDIDQLAKSYMDFIGNGQPSPTATHSVNTRSDSYT